MGVPGEDTWPTNADRALLRVHPGFLFVHQRVGASQNLLKRFTRLPLHETQSRGGFHFRTFCPGAERVAAKYPFLHALDVRLRFVDGAIQKDDKFIASPTPHRVSAS